MIFVLQLLQFFFRGGKKPFCYERNDVSLAAIRRFSASKSLLPSNQELVPCKLAASDVLTPLQWNYLKAVAKEQSVDKPFARGFIKKYNIGTSANSNRMLEALLDKELILATSTEDGVSYSVYNMFLSR